MTNILVLLLLLQLLIFANEPIETENKQAPKENLNSVSDEKPFSEWDYATGNWGGMRTDLQDRGIFFEIAYTGEVVSNVAGGVARQTEYLDNVDLIMSIDGEKLFGWSGSTFLIYGIGNYGGDPSENVGDAQGTSNIEAPDTFKLYEAWWQQNFFGDQLSFKIGLYDINSEFDVIEAAGLFLNGSHGIGADYSQSGVNGPSIFPVTSLAARVLVQATQNIYLLAAVLDGIPGDPDDEVGTHVILKRDDGLLFAGEIGYITYSENDESQVYSKYALGGWYYTEEFEDVAREDDFHRGNAGLYLLMEQTVICDGNSPRGVVYARIGAANSNVNQFAAYSGFGFAYTGLVPNRNEDSIGIATAIAYNGNDFINANGANAFEASIEFTYLAQITPWFTLQPNIQYVINPGTDPDLDDAVVLALRFSVLL
ncbi:carbohydrate porin [Candidatus Uabimicrobium sp. HlEnr_7]|uniref:carbohydrate porin n=1 Tax=Candidatus Uabimicrobium helgolandensis TaxID=3095367 RepID=UPI00355707CB